MNWTQKIVFVLIKSFLNCVVLGGCLYFAWRLAMVDHRFMAMVFFAIFVLLAAVDRDEKDA